MNKNDFKKQETIEMILHETFFFVSPNYKVKLYSSFSF